MEEDIKILETLKESYIKASECGLGYPSDNREDKRTAQALDNLIKGYRELEEKNKQCIKAGDLERAVGFLMNSNDLGNYIPKSKIKEIRDKAEVMDYYTLPDVIDDLNKLLEDEDDKDKM